MSLWSSSKRLDALCADWVNAEVNIAAGLENPGRTMGLALRLQAEFLVVSAHLSLPEPQAARERSRG